MEKVERERIGPFVITYAKDRDPNILCAMCEKLLALYNAPTDDFTPSIEQIYSEGAVPVPNFGWVCSQDCAEKYSQKFNASFARNKDGKVDYYPEG
jgi:hypothetical protein